MSNVCSYGDAFIIIVVPNGCIEKMSLFESISCSDSFFMQTNC